jgi:hypothetical protein
LYDAVSQCGFAVIDVCNDGKIADMLHRVQDENPAETGVFAKGEF